MWADAPGASLLMSVVLHTSMPAARLPGLSIAAGVAVAEALIDVAGLDARLKWPNDVLVDGKKSAGVLVEASARGPALEGVVIGVGVDVNRALFEELEDTATSLRRALGAPLDRAVVLARVLASIEDEVDRFVAHGPASIVARVEARLALRGERVRCDETQGVLMGLAPSGALRLDTALGVRELVAGTLRRA